MILVIPLCGISDEHFCKPLTIVNGKTILELSLENLVMDSSSKIFFILKEIHILNYSLDTHIKNLFNHKYNITIITCDYTTQSMPETLMLAKKELLEFENEQIIIYTPYIYLSEKLDLNQLKNNLIVTFKSNSNSHSYAKIDNNNNVLSIQEKKVISDNALIGLYSFDNVKMLFYYLNEMFDKKIKFNNKFYLSMLYSLIIKDNIVVKNYHIEYMYPLGNIKEQFLINKLYFNKLDKDKIIGLASDHSGYNAKNVMINVLKRLDIKFIDYGCFSDKNCDYYEYIDNLCNDIKMNKLQYGFGFCRTAQGVNICANKHSHIISALIYDDFSAQMSVEHNGANFFCFPEKDCSIDKFNNYINIILNNTFNGGRFLSRLIKMYNFIYE
uniref:Nucleotidyl transferase domain-containing protein n=1 Tax=viral metagenome TaxID=1070528 RepID=A0A6C0EIB3_9ZZZZ